MNELMKRMNEENDGEDSEDPGVAEFHNNAGVTYMRLKKYEQAHSSFSMAMKLDPGTVSDRQTADREKERVTVIGQRLAKDNLKELDELYTPPKRVDLQRRRRRRRIGRGWR